MQKVSKRTILRSTGKVVDFELDVADTIADCLELCDGNEQMLVQLFNKAYGAHIREQHKPKEKFGGQKTLAKYLKSVSPTVRDILSEHTPEEALDIIKRAQEKVESRRRDGTVS